MPGEPKKQESADGWRQGIRDLAEEQWRLYAAVRSPKALERRKPLEVAARDARSILRGRKAGLFRLKSSGSFDFAATGRGDAEVDNLNLGPEAAPHIAAAIELELDYGWKILVEPRGSRFGPAVAGKYPFDVVAYREDPAQTTVYCEAKGSSDLLDGLRSTIEACARAGPDHEAGSAETPLCRVKGGDHAKWAALWSSRPRTARPVFLWLVAPGERRAFRVEFSADRLALIEASDIPHADED